MTKPDYLGPYPDLYVGDQRLWRVFAGDRQVWPEFVNVWVMLTYDNIYYSSDGLSWSEANYPEGMVEPRLVGTSSDFTVLDGGRMDVDPSTGRWVIYTGNKDIIESYNGADWELIRPADEATESQTARSLTYGNGLWILTGTNDNPASVSYSTDAITWTEVTLPGFEEGDLFTNYKTLRRRDEWYIATGNYYYYYYEGDPSAGVQWGVWRSVDAIDWENVPWEEFPPYLGNMDSGLYDSQTRSVGIDFLYAVSDGADAIVVLDAFLPAYHTSIDGGQTYANVFTAKGDNWDELDYLDRRYMDSYFIEVDNGQPALPGDYSVTSSTIDVYSQYGGINLIHNGKYFLSGSGVKSLDGIDWEAWEAGAGASAIGHDFVNDRTIAAFYTYSTDPGEELETLEIRVSDDQGDTWSDPIDLPFPKTYDQIMVQIMHSSGLPDTRIL